MRRLAFLLPLLIIYSVALTTAPAWGSVIHVKWDSPTDGPGDSWANAYKTLAAAVNVSVAGDEIWVAGDTQHPYVERLVLRKSVGLYGGFAGTEVSREERNQQSNITIIHASSGSAIVCPSGATNATIIDGFTIRKATQGAIYCVSSSPTISNNVITGNVANDQGGGIRCVSASPLIRGNTISGNSAPGAGGGIYCTGACAPIIRNNAIHSNSAGRGGGVFCDYCSPVICDNDISDNSGGGIWCGSCTSVTISSNTISGNSGAGGVYCDACPASISGNSICQNSTSTKGGGICCTGDCSPEIRNNVISSNKAATGGGIYCGSCSPTISGNTISSSEGEGIWCESCTPTICNNTICASISSEQSSADGIHLRYCVGLASDNAVIDNAGNGLYAQYGTMQVVNNTIAANAKCGICCPSASTALSSNIVAYNFVGIQAVSSVKLSHNCVYTPDMPGNNYVSVSAGTTDIQDDPLLESVECGQVHLAAGSPCIDAGDDAAVGSGWTDIDGKSRLLGAHVDIGADEFDGESTWRPTVIRVSSSGNDDYDGSTWALAKKTVQAGIDAASKNSGEVWVAAGVFRELVTVRPKVRVYGGFAGTEDALNARDFRTNASIIDGRGAGCVVTIEGGTAAFTTGIDGCTLRNGNGVGLFCRDSATISNCTVIGTIGGCGIYCNYGSPVIRNCVVAGNGAYECAGIYAYRCVAAICGNTIAGNSGRGVLVYGDPGTIVCNNIVAFNSSGISGSGLTLRNNCVYNPDGNTSWDVVGPTDIQVDPQFISRQYGQFHLLSRSPCRDAGDDSFAQCNPLDIDGRSRIEGAHVDIGADEFDGTIWTSSPVTVRVSPSGNDANNGSSWALAKRTVQAGLDAAAADGGEVWVAAGIYNESVLLPSFVAMYGGFAGTEAAREDRRWAKHVTILDGGRAGSVVVADAGSIAVDGFTIRNGTGTMPLYSSPDSGGYYRCGGGICCFGSATIANNTITANTSSPGTGGGVYVASSASTIVNNVVTGNIADSGGGIFCESSSTSTIRGNTIANNSAYSGGGIYTNGGLVANNIVAGNSANWGGGLYCGSSIVSNNTIATNNAMRGGGAVCWSSSIRNNIIAFNSSGILTETSGSSELRCNCVYNPGGDNYAGMPAGAGDISTDPELAADYHLLPNSPCVNAGLNSAVGPSDVDIDGQARIMNTTVDIGADECFFGVSLQNCKRAHDGVSANIVGAVVSAAFNGFFYLELPNGSAGIRVEKAMHELEVGMRADVTGTMGTNGDGERCVIARDIFEKGSGNVGPFGLTNKALGGGAMGLQGGVWSLITKDNGDGTASQVWQQASGLNNIGLLVRTCGRVVEVEPVTPPALPTWFKIDDGSGVNVKCLVPSGVTIDANWLYVTVTGISSCERAGTELHSLLRVRAQSDIVAY